MSNGMSRVLRNALRLHWTMQDAASNYTNVLLAEMDHFPILQKNCTLTSTMLPCTEPTDSAILVTVGSSEQKKVTAWSWQVTAGSAVPKLEIPLK